MKIYLARRTSDEEKGEYVECTVFDGDDQYSLPHVVYHSPDGFEMGYGGSGPADLALSILFDYYGLKATKSLKEFENIYEKDSDARLAWQYHQEVKAGIVCKYRQVMRLNSDELTAFISGLNSEEEEPEEVYPTEESEVEVEESRSDDEDGGDRSI